jgi:hypothetical protein
MKGLFFFFIFTVAELLPSERKCLKSMLYNTDEIIEVTFTEPYNETELRQTIQNLGIRVIESFLCADKKRQEEELHQKEEQKRREERLSSARKECLKYLREIEQWNEEKWFFQSPKEIPDYNCKCNPNACEETKCLESNEPYDCSSCFERGMARGPPGYIPPCVNRIKIKL